MSYPNSALAAWQLALIALVVLSALAAWLILVYAAAQEPHRDDAGGQEAGLGGAAGALRSWVVGWTHRLDPSARRGSEANPAPGSI